MNRGSEQSMRKERIGILEGVGLGDGLVLMALANNLSRNGFDVVLFCSGIYPLRRWFKGVEIRPSLSFAELQPILSEFDQLVVDRNVVVDAEFLGNTKVLHLKKSNFDRRLDFVGNLLLVAKSKFGLSDLIREIQMTPPDSSLTYRKHEKRVLINPVAVNPVSTGISKGWPANKFIRLARKIKRKGYTPIFCVPPSEHAHWKTLLGGEFPLPMFKTLEAFSEYVYESGVNVANDSGSGHLASSLNIPTLSLFSRKNKATLWRPAWGQNQVAIATFHLPTPYARKFWKQLLTVGKVMRKFNQLQKERV